jgi:hypothetical protein
MRPANAGPPVAAALPQPVETRPASALTTSAGEPCTPHQSPRVPRMGPAGQVSRRSSASARDHPWASGRSPTAGLVIAFHWATHLPADAGVL